MKYAFIILFLIPLAGISQDKNVLNVTRVFPKIDKVLEFEKALKAHAQKYHTGDWKWRVGEIQTGPDAGGYNIIEGPHNWDGFDKRGNLGDAHTNDWNKTVAIHLTDKYQSFFLEYKPELSNVGLTEFSDKYAVTHVFTKPGMYGAAQEVLAGLKKTWTESNQSVVVYEASASGPTQFVIVYRYKTGLKERETGFLKPFKERHEAAHGAGSFDKYVSSVEKVTESLWSEMIFTRMDLGSQ